MKKAEKREQLDAQELTARIDELLRILEEKHEIVELTYRGRVIADIVPRAELIHPEDKTLRKSVQHDPAWEHLKQLSAELSAHWPPDVSVADAINDIRRDY